MEIITGCLCRGRRRTGPERRVRDGTLIKGSSKRVSWYHGSEESERKILGVKRLDQDLRTVGRRPQQGGYHHVTMPSVAKRSGKAGDGETGSHRGSFYCTLFCAGVAKLALWFVGAAR